MLLSNVEASLVSALACGLLKKIFFPFLFYDSFLTRTMGEKINRISFSIFLFHPSEHFTGCGLVQAAEHIFVFTRALVKNY